MLTVDNIIGIVAPHLCLMCGVEGHVLCPACVLLAGEPLPQRCAGCKRLSKGNKTCSSCRKWLKVDRIDVVTEYDELYEKLIHAYKFDCKRQAAEPIARMLSEHIRDSNALLCPLPTAPARIRERGFDHTALLAKYLTKLTNMTQIKTLKRQSNKRQLGADRSKRLQQMQGEFYVSDDSQVTGKKVLLIDDVVTTGATLAAAAETLRAAGAKQVDALVFAQKL